MKTLFEQRYVRTIDALVSRFADANAEGGTIEAWVFDDRQARRSAEENLRALGFNARIRSAYKPLLTFLLEEVALDQIEAMRIRYPCHPLAPDNRFCVEAYPLAALLRPGCVQFDQIASDQLEYLVDYQLSDGSRHIHNVFAPNHQYLTARGDVALVPTGWLRVSGGCGSCDQRLVCDYEQVFDDVVNFFSDSVAVGPQPYFDRLDIDVRLSAAVDPLDHGDERLSTAEALHEDLYFALIERSQIAVDAPARGLSARPGQIVPLVTAGASEISVSIRRPQRIINAPAPPAFHELARAPEPIGMMQIVAELEALGGEPLAATSAGGLAVPNCYHAGEGPALLITGAQHGNEASGVVGALRAAQALASRNSRAHFAVIPAENIDGYLLHLELCERYPGDLNHAARYSSLGDDLEERGVGPQYELNARRKALELSGAALHVSLHGYPAHEWVRVLAGYFPPRAQKWTIPQGFYLLMSYQPGCRSIAEAMLDRVAAQLGAYPGLREFNEEQAELYRQHAGESPLEWRHGVLCGLGERPHQETRLKLITEFPDESIRGQPFIFAHSVQAATVIAAAAALDELTAAFPAVLAPADHTTER